MKHILTHKLFILSAVLALLLACQPKAAKQPENAVKESAVDRVAVELVLHDQSQRDSLLSLLGQTPFETYQWKNHLVLFGADQDTAGIAGRIRETGIGLTMKKYDSAMYVFDRALQCGDSVAAKPWRNYLLTANLVADTSLQKEYLHYHAVQQTDWPEVAQGFCNADFQQLIVFRKGRQLLLVISIPADKTLDKLNPKTEENNPRVVEWNKIMSKYQEGIEGTAPGESWVFLKRLKPQVVSSE